MADFDVRNDTTPAQEFDLPHKPTISAMRTSLLTVNGGNSYPAAVLNTMTYNDMVYACRVHGLTPVGL